MKNGRMTEFTVAEPKPWRWIESDHRDVQFREAARIHALTCSLAEQANAGLTLRMDFSLCSAPFRLRPSHGLIRLLPRRLTLAGLPIHVARLIRLSPVSACGLRSISHRFPRARFPAAPLAVRSIDDDDRAVEADGPPS